MRHHNSNRKFGRKRRQRASLKRSLAISLIGKGKITTTEAKAKAIKGLVDKIITQAKNKDTRMFVSEFLTQRQISDKLIKDIAPAVKGRNSGYTSIIKLGTRAGDNAMAVRMSLLMEEKSDKTERGVTARRGSRRMTAVDENERGRTTGHRAGRTPSETRKKTKR